MNDLNTMLRQQAQSGLQAQLDRAVEAGETETARKVADQIAQLAVQTAPKPSAFTNGDIKSALEAKAAWFGVDPKKSAKTIEFGNTMDPKKFASAALYAEALIKAVDEEFKPAGTVAAAEEVEDDSGDEDENDEGEKKPPKATRRTDGPGERDGGVRPGSTRRQGPWLKIADAPREVQVEITRSADKFAPKTKEGRDKFMARALEAHYNIHQIHQQKQAKK